MIDPAIGTLFALACVVLFAVAAIHKLRDLRAFRDAFESHALVAGGLYPIIPALEVLVATGLLFADTRLAASVLGALLLVTYAFAIALSLRRGRSDLLCGCAGPARRSISRHMVWRNCAAAVICIVGGMPRGARALEGADVVTILGGFSALVALYWSIDELFGQTQSGTRRALEVS
jgi:hypothetical protein